MGCAHEYCAVCHGGAARVAFTHREGHVPAATATLRAAGDHHPEGITFWKVTNGIRMTGMPAFQNLLSGTERWQVTMLLAHADGLPAGVLAGLSP
jgi:mono/diheme cytochrome c family protein